MEVENNTKISLMTNLAELEKQTAEENNNYNKYFLTKRKIEALILVGGSILTVVFFLLGAVLTRINDVFMIVFSALGLLTILATPIAWGIVAAKYTLKMSNTKKTIEHNAKIQPKLSADLKELVFNELCQQFAITPYQLDYDLNSILTPDMRTNWWCVQGKIDVVTTALSRKYQRTANDMAKSDLEVENLKLQNESIAIDNVQKKFWTCTYCGNMNRADDMSCIKCGAIRPNTEG